MLTVLGADTITGLGSVPAADSPSFTLVSSTTSGTLTSDTFQFTAAQSTPWTLSSNATAGNSFRIGRLIATVPNTAVYGSKERGAYRILPARLGYLSGD